MPTLAEVALLEFPRHLHKPSVPPDWVYLIVRDKHECAAALASGWSLHATIVGQEPVEMPPLAVSPDIVDPPTLEPPRRLRGWPKGKARKVVA